MLKTKHWGQKNKLNSKVKLGYFSYPIDHLMHLFFRKQDLIYEGIFSLKCLRMFRYLYFFNTGKQGRFFFFCSVCKVEKWSIFSQTGPQVSVFGQEHNGIKGD